MCVCEYFLEYSSLYHNSHTLHAGLEQLEHVRMRRGRAFNQQYCSGRVVLVLESSVVCTYIYMRLHTYIHTYIHTHKTTQIMQQRGFLAAGYVCVYACVCVLQKTLTVIGGCRRNTHNKHSPGSSFSVSTEQPKYTTHYSHYTAHNIHTTLHTLHYKLLTLYRTTLQTLQYKLLTLHHTHYTS
jgi:hypothetical protein